MKDIIKRLQADCGVYVKASLSTEEINVMSPEFEPSAIDGKTEISEFQVEADEATQLAMLELSLDEHETTMQNSVDSINSIITVLELKETLPEIQNDPQATEIASATMERIKLNLDLMGLAPSKESFMQDSTVSMEFLGGVVNFIGQVFKALFNAIVSFFKMVLSIFSFGSKSSSGGGGYSSPTKNSPESTLDKRLAIVMHMRNKTITHSSNAKEVFKFGTSAIASLGQQLEHFLENLDKLNKDFTADEYFSLAESKLKACPSPMLDKEMAVLICDTKHRIEINPEFHNTILAQEKIEQMFKEIAELMTQTSNEVMPMIKSKLAKLENNTDHSTSHEEQKNQARQVQEVIKVISRYSHLLHHLRSVKELFISSMAYDRYFKTHLTRDEMASVCDYAKNNTVTTNKAFTGAVDWAAMRQNPLVLLAVKDGDLSHLLSLS